MPATPVKMNLPNLPLGEQLRSIAAASTDMHQFAFERRGHTIRVSYFPNDSLNVWTPLRGGDAAALDGASPAVLAAPRPMAIEIRKARATDRERWESGINKKIATVDRAFDAQVRVETATADEIVGAVLATVSAQAAVLDLLDAGCTAVLIDDQHGDILLSLGELTTDSTAPTCGERIVDALVRLAAALPEVRATGEPRPGNAQRLVANGLCALAGIGLPAFPLAAFAAAPAHCLEAARDDGVSLDCSAGPDCCFPLVEGLSGGLLVSIPVVWLLSKYMRGQARSHQPAAISQIAAVVLLLELGFILGRLLL